MGREVWQYALFPGEFTEESGLVAVGVIDTGENLQPTGTVMAVDGGEKVRIIDEHGCNLARYGDVTKLGIEELRRRRARENQRRQGRYREKMSQFLTDGRVDVEMMRRIREETCVMQPERENPRIPGLVAMMVDEVRQEKPGAVSREFVNRWSDVVENLALLAAVSEKELGNTLMYMRGRILLNAGGLKQENIERLAGYVTGEDRIQVGKLDGQAREAGEVILRAVKVNRSGMIWDK